MFISFVMAPTHFLVIIFILIFFVFNGKSISFCTHAVWVTTLKHYTPYPKNDPSQISETEEKGSFFIGVMCTYSIPPSGKEFRGQPFLGAFK